VRLISFALDPRHAHRRQALRRHAQRHHEHFYRARAGWSLVRNFARAPLSWQRERWVIAGIAGLIALLALSLPAGTRGLTVTPANANWANLAVALPPLVERAAPATPLQPGMFAGVYAMADDADRWTRYTVKPGQTLGDIFADLGYSKSVLERVANAPRTSRSLGSLKPGEPLAFLSGASGKLGAMQFDSDEATRVVLRVADDNGIYLQRVPRALERRVRLASGVIDDTLFGAAAAAGLSTSAMLKMADIFAYDIDFAQDLREGDRFAVVFEEIWRDGEKLRDGDILAASFTNQGREHVALRFTRTDGSAEYYGDDGRSLRKAFLRTPVEFTRISSGFSVARMHPILGTMRAHRGVDYAAPSGTPIRAAGDGRVIARGWQAGYGNVVQIDHGNKVSTVYGHMARFGAGITNGTRVRQGQVIGYVGMTGLATGPHLHYEFRVNGAHRDPLRFTPPPAPPLSGTELAQFRSRTAPLVSDLAQLTQDSTLKLAAR
jgi:murein DD-endopeptidase MepM/ murein hydrolase activator NlpD